MKGDRVEVSEVIASNLPKVEITLTSREAGSSLVKRLGQLCDRTLLCVAAAYSVPVGTVCLVR